MPTDKTMRSDSLAHHADGLRRLVRGLVYSDAEADDVVQDTLVAALERDEAPRHWGAWLSRVARNQASNLRRSEGRRTRRQHAAARAESQPAASDVAARLEEKQRLLDCLGRLEEPYRETLVLRYFEDLPPRAIAERRRVPVSTVKTHLQRGVARLRALLDEAHGGQRQRWQAALLPLVGAGAERSILTTALGWITMKTATLGLVGAALILVLGWSAQHLWLAEGDARSARVEAPAERRADADTAVPAAPTLSASALSDGPTRAVAGPTTTQATRANSIHGRVTDLAGSALAGAVVRTVDGRFRTTSDADGSFLLGPLPSGPQRLEARAEQRARRTYTAPDRGAFVHFQLEPAYRLALIVVDREARRLAGAEVRYVARGDALDDQLGETVITDAEGVAELHGVLAEPGALFVSAEGHASAYVRVRASMVVDAGHNQWTTIALSRRARVVGTVVDARTGAGIPGASLSLGSGTQRTVVTSGAGGSFELRPTRDASLRTVLRAHALGYRAVWRSLDGPALREPIRLELEPHPPLTGTVVDAAGRPVADAKVAYAGSRMRHDLQTTTGRRGRFELAMPPATGPTFSGPVSEETRARLLAKVRVALRAEHPEHGHAVIGLRPGDLTRPIELRLTGTGAVVGRVTREDGTPAVGAVVRLLPRWKESRDVLGDADRLQSHLWASRVHPAAVTGLDGTYRIAAAPAARYRVEARHGLDEVATRSEIELVHGSTETIDLSLAEELTIRGRVRDQFGRPVAGVVIFPVAGEMDVLPATHSRSDGSFLIRGLEPGSYGLMLEAPNMHLAKQPRFLAGAQDAWIDVERSVPFQVEVVHAGKPYTKRFKVVVLDAARKEPAREAGMVVGGERPRMMVEAFGPKGQCTVSGLPPGRYRLRVETTSGLASAEEPVLRLGAGDKPPIVRIELVAR